ncbi:hypothetical protein OG900_01130 [Streptomyces sp. NBC_00433]
MKADGFTAQHLTFRDLSSRQANPSATGTQAVALATEGDRQSTLPAAIRTEGPWTGVSGAAWTPGRYGEHADTGPGATVDSARSQLPAANAAAFTAAACLAGGDGWNPAQ